MVWMWTSLWRRGSEDDHSEQQPNIMGSQLVTQSAKQRAPRVYDGQFASPASKQAANVRARNCSSQVSRQLFERESDDESDVEGGEPLEQPARKRRNTLRSRDLAMQLMTAALEHICNGILGVALR
jgi:hypothetical protein